MTRFSVFPRARQHSGCVTSHSPCFSTISLATERPRPVPLDALVVWEIAGLYALSGVRHRNPDSWLAALSHRDSYGNDNCPIKMRPVVPHREGFQHRIESSLEKRSNYYRDCVSAIDLIVKCI
jgi:hypothetical protein